MCTSKVLLGSFRTSKALPGELGKRSPWRLASHCMFVLLVDFSLQLKFFLFIRSVLDLCLERMSLIFAFFFLRVAPLLDVFSESLGAKRIKGYKIHLELPV